MVAHGCTSHLNFHPHHALTHSIYQARSLTATPQYGELLSATTKNDYNSVKALIDAGANVEKTTICSLN